MKLNRILLKLSGEALGGKDGRGFSDEEVMRVAAEVKKLRDAGTEIGIVIGGGNFWRGRTSGEMDRVKADEIGMLATVMNAVYAADAFQRTGMDSVVMTPYAIGDITELYVRDRAVAAMKEKKIVFFAGGTGHPYFSTDMAAVLRAVETQCDGILSAKAIDGVYDSDPAVNPGARKIDTLSMTDLIDQKLGVIDLAAAVLARENHMPMILFGLKEKDSILRAAAGESIGTKITA